MCISGAIFEYESEEQYREETQLLLKEKGDTGHGTGKPQLVLDDKEGEEHNTPGTQSIPEHWSQYFL